MALKDLDKTRIFAHRGLWSPGGSEPNSISALNDAIRLGFSVETDIRDWNGELVISHDPPTVSPMKLMMLSSTPRTARVAFNIKSDGLLALGLRRHLMPGDFVFDCSIPESVKYLRAEIPVADRFSEYEPEQTLDSGIVWVDGFSERSWLASERDLEKLLDSGKELVFVSPELHGRPFEEAWSFLERVWENPSVNVCTDFPLQFLEYVR